MVNFGYKEILDMELDDFDIYYKIAKEEYEILAKQGRLII